MILLSFHVLNLQLISVKTLCGSGYKTESVLSMLEAQAVVEGTIVGEIMIAIAAVDVVGTTG